MSSPAPQTTPATSTSLNTRLDWRWWLLFAPLAIAPAIFALVQLGRWHPDEVFQFLEPAFMHVHGQGFRTWEWDVGLRNWAAPLVIASLIRWANLLAITDPQAQRAIIALPQVLLHGAMLVAAFRYAQRRLGAGDTAALIFTMLMVGIYAPVLLLAGRTMSESLSAPLLVLAFERLDREGDAKTSTRNGAWAGLWLGLSVVARYGSAVFVIATIVWLAATRRWRALAATCVAGFMVALALGVLDWVTWGRPWHSMFAYVHFNAISGHAAERFGAEPAWYYLPLMTLWPAVWVWPGAFVETMRQRRLPLPVFAALCYFIAISATGHKEERFLYPFAVVLIFAAAPGVALLLRDRLRAGVPRAVVSAIVLLIGLIGFVGMPDVRSDLFHATLKIARDPRSTGIVYVGSSCYDTGASLFVGQRMNWHASSELNTLRKLAHARPDLNRAISTHGYGVPQLREAGFEIVDSVGRHIILERDSLALASDASAIQ